MDLKVSADQRQGFVAVQLVDEAPDGGQTLITRGFANLTHRNNDTDPEAVVPGEVMDITVPLHGIGYRIKAGHRLVVQIASNYWPILWPSPKPVTLTLTPGQSALSLPVRNATEDTPRDLPEPEKSEFKRRVTRVRDGSMERSFHTDLTTGETTHRFFLDGGVFGPVGDLRLDETGTVLSDISDRKYMIHADDPLSARATMEQTASFERDDWHAKISCFAEQTATEKEFHLTSRVTCWSGEEEVFSREKTYTIPRNGM